MTGDRWTGLVTRVLAPNPGPMTLDGTNSLVIAPAGHGGVVVVDPGPADDAHLDRLAAFGDVELILITHHHHDHTEGIDGLVARTGAPVRARQADLCRDAEPLADGETIRIGDAEIRVIATPGHTADSVCFLVAGDGVVGGPQEGAVITGDTILGRGTTVIIPPDGSLGDYLASLRTLAALGPLPVLPAHGPMLDDLAAVCAQYLAHRQGRLGLVRAALASLGKAPADDPALISAVVDRVYTGIDPAVRFAAEASTRAQLIHLADEQAG